MSLKISGDGSGHFKVSGFAKDESDNRVKLTIDMSFDQTEISGMVVDMEISPPSAKIFTLSATL